MRKKIITLFYFVAAYIIDFAYYVIGRGVDNEERAIETPWATHYNYD